MGVSSAGGGGQEARLQALVGELLGRQVESRSLDYKAARSFGKTRAEKADVVRWLMAFSNNRDGGYILVGAAENGDGRFELDPVSESDAASFDPTDIGNFARNYCSVSPRVTVQTVMYEGSRVVLLRVAEFESEPIVCIKDCHDEKGALLLRSGSIYARTPDAKSAPIESGEEMRALLDLAVQKRGDVLLSQIRGLVGHLESSNPRTAVEPYQAEQLAARQFFDDKGIVSPYWSVEILPGTYMKDRIGSNQRLREIRRETAVSVRGWDFPHVDREYDKIFEDGIESYTDWSYYHEAHRFYRSGLFAWRKLLKEDGSVERRGTISYVSSVYSITEFLLFASRYAAMVLDDGDVVVRIGLDGIDQRELQLDAQNSFGECYSTGAKVFFWEEVVDVGQLRATHLELARAATVRFCDLFGLSVSDEVVEGWQRQLLKQNL